MKKNDGNCRNCKGILGDKQRLKEMKSKEIVGYIPWY